MSNDLQPIVLTVQADPSLARLVRMTAANVAMLSSMSVDRVEDIRMAAEEAFIYVCSMAPLSTVHVNFVADPERVAMNVTAENAPIQSGSTDNEACAYADLILQAVCDSFSKSETPFALDLELKADC